MSYHTPQYFLEDYADVLFFQSDGTIRTGENHHTVTSTMDMATMNHMGTTVNDTGISIMQMWPLSNPPTDSPKNSIFEGDVFYSHNDHQFCVYNPDSLDVPRGMVYHTSEQYFGLCNEPCDWKYVGHIDLHLFNVPRYIRSDDELNKFLPNYDAWFANLLLHNQSAIDQGTASKVNHIIRRLLVSPEEVQNSFWFKREFARHFAPATFKAQRTFPSFCTEGFFIDNLVAPLTFPHYSAQEPGQVAFQPIDPSMREADRQIRTKPGRYLNKFLDLDSDQVRKCVSIENGDRSVQLKFAKTVDEFTNVYLRGPSSCMSHGIDWYDASASTERLPVSIFANGDIEVAYLEIDGGIIPARVIVVQSDMEMLDIYCNNDAMDGARGELLSQLRDAGYSYNSTALVGQKIERIPIDDDEDVFVCPYIDCGGLPVSDTGDYLQICHEGEGEMIADYQTGVCRSTSKHCNHCDQDHDSETEYVEDVGDVCEGCIENDFVYAYCRGNERFINREDAIFVESMGEWYLGSTLVLEYYNIYICSVTDEYYHTDDLVTCQVSNDYVHEDEVSYIGNGLHVSNEYAVYSDYLGRHLIEADAVEISMDDGTSDWFPDDEIEHSEYHQQSIPTCLASEIDGDYYWTSHLVCDEVGNYSLLEITTPITLETAA